MKSFFLFLLFSQCSHKRYENIFLKFSIFRILIPTFFPLILFFCIWCLTGTNTKKTIFFSHFSSDSFRGKVAFFHAEKFDTERATHPPFHIQILSSHHPTHPVQSIVSCTTTWPMNPTTTATFQNRSCFFFFPHTKKKKDKMSTIAWVIASVSVTVLIMLLLGRSTDSSPTASSSPSPASSSPSPTASSSPTASPSLPSPSLSSSVIINANANANEMMYPTYDQVFLDVYRPYVPQSLLPDPYARWYSRYDYVSPGYNWISGGHPYPHHPHHPHPPSPPQPPSPPVVNVTQNNKNINARPGLSSPASRTSLTSRMSGGISQRAGMKKSPRRSAGTKSTPVPTAAAAVLSKLENPSSST